MQHQIISARGCAGFLLVKDHFLKVITPTGVQVADLFCFNANDYDECLSSGRSIDHADSIYLTKNNSLYSNRRNKLLTIVEDSCGRHDFLLTPCTEDAPGCQKNLAQIFQDRGISSDRIGTTFNIFMNVEVSPHGKIEIQKPQANAGDSIIFQAEMDLLVGLTACSHLGTNAGSCKPIYYEVFQK